MIDGLVIGLLVLGSFALGTASGRRFCPVCDGSESLSGFGAAPSGSLALTGELSSAGDFDPLALLGEFTPIGS